MSNKSQVKAAKEGEEVGDNEDDELKEGEEEGEGEEGEK